MQITSEEYSKLWEIALSEFHDSFIARRYFTQGIAFVVDDADHENGERTVYGLHVSDLQDTGAVSALEVNSEGLDNPEVEHTYYRFDTVAEFFAFLGELNARHCRDWSV